jgi:hypothetical protein
LGSSRHGWGRVCGPVPSANSDLLQTRNLRKGTHSDLVTAKTGSNGKERLLLFDHNRLEIIKIVLIFRFDACVGLQAIDRIGHFQKSADDY